MRYVKILTHWKNEFEKTSEMREGFCCISVTGHSRPNTGKCTNEDGGGGGGGGCDGDDDCNDNNQMGCVYRSLL